MNRLQYVDAALGERYSNKTKATHWNRKPNQPTQHFRQFIPLHYEKNYSYPLLVWLHGPTGSEFEINQVMPHISMRNYVGVCPRGVVKHEATHPNGDATFTWNQDHQSIECAVDDVLHCVDYAKRRFNINSDRVFLVGNDVGGTMALRIALSKPELFAGVASIGGAMPDANCPLARIQNARSLPVLIAHGRDSEEFDTQRLCTDLRLLHSAGMPVTVRQYPCGHEVTTKMLSDLNCWVMERVAGVCSDVPICDDPTHLRIQDFN